MKEKNKKNDKFKLIFIIGNNNIFIKIKIKLI